MTNESLRQHDTERTKYMLQNRCINEIRKMVVSNVHLDWWDEETEDEVRLGRVKGCISRFDEGMKKAKEKLAKKFVSSGNVITMDVNKHHSNFHKLSKNRRKALRNRLPLVDRYVLVQIITASSVEAVDAFVTQVMEQEHIKEKMFKWFGLKDYTLSFEQGRSGTLVNTVDVKIHYKKAYIVSYAIKFFLRKYIKYPIPSELLLSHNDMTIAFSEYINDNKP